MQYQLCMNSFCLNEDTEKIDNYSHLTCLANCDEDCLCASEFFSAYLKVLVTPLRLDSSINFILNFGPIIKYF